MDSSDVKIGLDGWMFLTGGSNYVLRFYTEQNYFSDDHVETWRALIQNRKNFCDNNQIRYRHILAPEKLTVFPEFFGEELSHMDRAPGRRMDDAFRATELQNTFLNPTAILKLGAGIFPTYYKTDTHWTPYGAYLAYQTLCWSLGYPPSLIIDPAQFQKRMQPLDLGSKFNPPINEEILYLQTSKNVRRIFANEIVQLRDSATNGEVPPMHHGTHVVYANDDAPQKECVVLFGDSFSGYGTGMLTSMLAETFSEVHFIWSADIDYNYVTKSGAKIVLSQLAERFMGIVPNDDFNIYQFVEERLQNHHKQLGKNSKILDEDDVKADAVPESESGSEKINSDPDPSHILNIDFSSKGNSQQYIVSGWQNQEQTHIWCDGEDSTIQINDPPHSLQTGKFWVEFDVGLFLHAEQRPTQYLRITINEYVIFASHLQRADTYRVRVNMPNINSGDSININIYHPDCLSPLDLDGSPDSRNLSVGFRRMTFLYAE